MKTKDYFNNEGAKLMRKQIKKTKKTEKQQNKEVAIAVIIILLVAALITYIGIIFNFECA